MFSLFQRPDAQQQPKQPVSATKITGKIADRLERGKTAIEGTTAALAVAGIAASGPAIPIVLATATVALVLARAYSQTKTLAKEFRKTYTIIMKVNDLLLRLQAVATKRNLPIDLSGLVDAVTEIETVIAKYASPKVLAAIREMTLQANGTPGNIQAQEGIFKAVKSFAGRWMTPAQITERLKESRNNLALQLSLVTAEYSLALDSPENADLVSVPPAAPPTPQQVDAEIAKAEVIAQTPEPTEVPQTPAAAGGTMRRRRKRRGKTLRRVK